MRLNVFASLALLVCGVVHGQAIPSAEQVIRREVETGIFDGHDSKVLGNTGDAAAVLVTKIFAGREFTPANIDATLTVLRSSFADPSLVRIADDRQPKTALFVLRYLDNSANDPALKKSIKETREFILQRYEKYVHDSQAEAHSSAP